MSEKVLDRESKARGSLNQRQLIYALVIIVACLLIFVLPFCFPPSTPVRSASYVYGFNNSLCIGAVLLSIGLMYIFVTRLNTTSTDWLLSAFNSNAVAPGTKVPR
jgi:hypothetical protein